MVNVVWTGLFCEMLVNIYFLPYMIRYNGLTCDPMSPLERHQHPLSLYIHNKQATHLVFQVLSMLCPTSRKGLQVWTYHRVVNLKAPPRGIRRTVLTWRWLWRRVHFLYHLHRRDEKHYPTKHTHPHTQKKTWACPHYTNQTNVKKKKNIRLNPSTWHSNSPGRIRWAIKGSPVVFPFWHHHEKKGGTPCTEEGDLESGSEHVDSDGVAEYLGIELVFDYGRDSGEERDDWGTNFI